MITVMDMETSYVIVVYSNDVSFTTSAHTVTSHPRHSEMLKIRDSRDGGDVDADTSPDVRLEMRDHKDAGHINLTIRQPERGNIAQSVFTIKDIL